MKYPYPSKMCGEKANKFGYFLSEKDIFININNVLNNSDTLYMKRHPLVYLVEAADDTCNLVMDFEDAIKDGHCTVEELWRDFGIDDLLKINHLTHEEKTELEGAKYILKGFDSNIPISRRALKELEKIRATTIGLLVKHCFKTYKEKLFAILNGTDYNLLDSLPIKSIKERYLHNSLYCHTRKMKLELSGDRIIYDLLKLFLKALSDIRQQGSFEKCPTRTKHLLRFLGIGPSPDPDFVLSNLSDYKLCLKAIDFISQCSDKYLIRLHKELTDFDP